MDDKEKDMVKYIKSLWILITIRNCVTLICFTTLAVVFRHWWIALFSILFYGTVGKSKD